LDNLPSTLQIVWCSDNQLTSLDNLPSKLQIVWCSNNQLTSLDNLPSTLQILHCEKNPICEKLYVYPSIENFKKYNEIKRIEKECCPLLK